MKTITKILLIFVILVIGLMIILSFQGEKLKYSTGRDTFAVFGDGRFQILRGSTISLWDQKMSLVKKTTSYQLVYDINKFIEKGQFIYLIGYYTYQGIKDKYKISHAPWNAINPETGEEIKYSSINEVPRYTILNYETGAIRLYKTLEEVPEEDRVIFEQKCEEKWFERGCWEKGMKH